MSISLVTRERGTPRKINLVSTYQPCSDTSNEEAEEFYEKYDEFLGRIKTSDINIIGCDANVNLGTAANNHDKKFLGKYGSDRPSRDTLSHHRTRNFLIQQALRASTTDYQQKAYSTWYSVGLRVSNQIDYFFTSRHARRRIHDARRVGTGIPSDHSAIRLKLRINNFEKNSTHKKARKDKLE